MEDKDLQSVLSDIEKAGKVKATLETPGWQEVIQVYLDKKLTKLRHINSIEKEKGKTFEIKYNRQDAKLELLTQLIGFIVQVIQWGDLQTKKIQEKDDRDKQENKGEK